MTYPGFEGKPYPGARWLDVTAEVNALCEKFKLDPDDVMEVVLRPGEAHVTVFLHNEAGKKFVVLDEEHPQYGFAATEVHKFILRRADDLRRGELE